MKKLTGVLLGLSFVVGGICTIAAQDKMDGTTPPPKVLVIYREFLKPGKSGATHEKSESAFVQAANKAKWQQHYLAVDSLSGRIRSLFLFPYDSFDAWEKDAQATHKNTALQAVLDRAAVADGDLLSEMDAAVLTYNEEQSLRAPVDIAHMRYFEISLFQVRPGHGKEWADLVKLVISGYEKIAGAHWAMYQVAYGQQPSPTYAVFVPRKSAAEIDHAFVEDKDFVAALGDDGMKKLRELEAVAVESSQTNLFAFNPTMSYPPDEWVKADPDFWKPKATPSAPKKTADKPATPQ